MRSLRQLSRSFRSSPGAAVSLLGISALAIGASAAIWSAANAVLLQPLPYAEPDRLVLVWNDMVKRNIRDFPFAPADFEDLRTTATGSFEEFAGVVTSLRPVSGDGGIPEQVPTAGVTPNLFTLLGAPMVLGRAFEETDGSVDASGPAAGSLEATEPRRLVVAILSHEFWRSRYGGDPGILGRRLMVGSTDADIVGVLAPGFQLLFPAGTGVEREPAVYTALRIDYGSGSRANAFLRVVGRLRPGVTLAAAQQELAVVEQDLRRRFEIKEAAGLRIRVEEMHDNLVADVKLSILALLGAAGLVLLIGCASVGGLTLLSVLRQERDLAIRRALGASAWGVIRGQLLEALMIGTAGLGAGITVALVILRLLTRYAPADLPRFDSLALDGLSLTVAALAILTSLASFSVLAVLRALRTDGKTPLRALGVRSEGRRRSVRDVILVVQVALSFVLLTGSGLLLRSFVALHQVDPGFVADGVLTFSIGSARESNAADREQFARAFRDRLEALPGVVSVSAVGPLPLDGTVSNVPWGTEEMASDPEQFQQATAHFVLPGYLETMRTRVLAGRPFVSADNQRDSKVIVIDRLLAEKAFPQGDAIGRRLLVRVRGPEPEWMEVIGVVDHQRHASLAAEGPEAIFFPNAFLGHNGVTRWVIRSTRSPASLTPEVRTILGDIDSFAALAQVRPMSSFLKEARGQTRFALLLLAIFSFLTVLLTAAGIYGSISTSVRQRTKEIGVRLALGASSSTIMLMTLKRGAMIGAGGIAIGAALALLLTRYLEALLVGVSPNEPVTFVAMALGFGGITVLASWFPARRAARLHPTVALRDG
jgi:predicted permease